MKILQNNEKSDRKAPGFWFYPADYERDMQILSLAAQGLWSRMLCWMHDNEAHRGFAELPTGEPMQVPDIAARVGKPVFSVEKCLSEMDRIGTFSRDERGCIYCRRMARDTHISSVRKAAAKSRMDTSKRAADGSFAGNFAPPNEPAKSEQNPTVTASASASVSDSSKTQEPTEEFPAALAPAKRPTAASLNGQVSQRFKEWYEPYPLKADRDADCRVWVSRVTVSDEAAAFACRDRYLLSKRVADGFIMGAAKFIDQQARNRWNGEWPAPTVQKTKQQLESEAWSRA